MRRSRLGHRTSVSSACSNCASNGTSFLGTSLRRYLGSVPSGSLTHFLIVLRDKLVRRVSAHLKLCASRAFWLVAWWPTHEMLFDAHT